MWAEPKIDVRVPFEPNGRLGEDYNRIMEESAHEWVLFLDHDVLIIHPCWYQVCQAAILNHPDAGIFTAWSNNIGNKKQQSPGAPTLRHSVILHKNHGHRVWQMHKYACSNIDPHLIGGFFILTSRTAWIKAGKFRGTGLLGEDNEYHRRMMACGLKTYRINGIYALHLRERGEPSWIPGVKTTVEFWREYKKRHEKNALHGDHR